MTVESARVLRLGLLVGAVFGAVLGVCRLAVGAPLVSALLWALAGVGIALLLAGGSALGIWLQRKDLPPPT